MWDAKQALTRAEWHASPQGAFVLEQQEKLLSRLFADWPRRGCSVLDIGCGTGTYLELLWLLGFDVTGFDASDELFESIRARLGSRVALQAGALDTLPFDDNAFDYVTLIAPPSYEEAPGQLLAEAIRVADKGVLVGFFNTCSPAWFAARLVSLFRQAKLLPHTLVWRPFWFWWKQARALCPTCSVSFQSVLTGPFCTWKEASFWRPMNKAIVPLPFGACAVMRLDVQNRVPLTALPLHSRKNDMQVCAATNGGAHSELPLVKTPQMDVNIHNAPSTIISRTEETP